MEHHTSGMLVLASAMKMVSSYSSSVHIISSALPIHSLQSRSSTAYPGRTQDPSIGTNWTLLSPAVSTYTLFAQPVYFTVLTVIPTTPLVITKVAFRARKLYHVRNHTKVRINAVATSIPEKAAKF